MGEWKIDPSQRRNISRPHVVDPCSELFQAETVIEWFLMCLPTDWVKKVMLPATNKMVTQNGHKEFSYEEFIHVLRILYFMESVQLPEHRMYWWTESRFISSI